MDELWARVSESFDRQPLMRTLQAYLHKVEHGEVQIELAYSEDIVQHNGFVHAGAVASVLDSACGYAALTALPDGYDVVTAEYKINLLRPALGQRFVAIGKVQNSGKSLTVCTGEILAFKEDGSSKVVALMQSTIANIPPSADASASLPASTSRAAVRQPAVVADAVHVNPSNRKTDAI
ncbi:PaaI family thioesterase [Pseudomonas sp. GM84]|uniref:PaaI family thioesterase n=1 Tax=Pseudomonas sp. GM84 TaxID=1144340 RepID=UPI0009D9B5F6|nr:PaaI family thioesterase [Pseudomonas sp. GM84]